MLQVLYFFLFDVCHNSTDFATEDHFKIFDCCTQTLIQGIFALSVLTILKNSLVNIVDMP